MEPAPQPAAMPAPVTAPPPAPPPLRRLPDGDAGYRATPCAPRPSPAGVAGGAPLPAGSARLRATGAARALAAGAVLLAATLAPAPPATAETLVATRTIRPATPIGPADVTVVAETHPGALSDPEDVVGQEARVALYPGRPIRPGDVAPAAVVERNAIVSLVYRRGGLSILAEGRALGRGAPGETVRVMNLSSRSTVSGLIATDGSVHVAGSSRPTH